MSYNNFFTFIGILMSGSNPHNDNDVTSLSMFCKFYLTSNKSYLSVKCSFSLDV